MLVEHKEIDMATATTETKVRTFEVGETYTMRWAYDVQLGALHTPYRVVKRTAQFVTFTEDKVTYEDRTVRVKVRTDDKGNEWCLPHGTYARSPVLRA